MVIFSDESRFQLFSSPGDLMVGLGCEKADKPQCLAPHVKFGRVDDDLGVLHQDWF